MPSVVVIPLPSTPGFPWIARRVVRVHVILASAYDHVWTLQLNSDRSYSGMATPKPTGLGFTPQQKRNRIRESPNPTLGCTKGRECHNGARSSLNGKDRLKEQ